MINKDLCKNEVKEYVDIYFDEMCNDCENCCLGTEEVNPECKIIHLFMGLTNIFGVDLKLKEGGTNE